VFVFFFAGVADMLWHVTFGIESGVEGLISPSHLALALGGGLMLTGPLRAGLARPAFAGRSWLDRMPTVVSLTLVLSLLTFFTEYASPYGTMWVGATPRTGSHAYLSAGMAGFLVQPAVLMGLVLFVLRRQPLPIGSLTVLLSVNVALMTIIHDKYLDTGPYPLIAAAILAGLVGDALVWWLQPSPDRPRALRTVAFPLPDPDTGSVRGDVLGIIRFNLEHATRKAALLMPRLMVEGADDPGLFAAMQEVLVEPRRAVMRAILQRGIERGEVRPDVDIDVAIDLLIGPYIYAVLYTGADLAAVAARAEEVLDLALPGLAPTPASRARARRRSAA